MNEKKEAAKGRALIEYFGSNADAGWPEQQHFRAGFDAGFDAGRAVDNEKVREAVAVVEKMRDEIVEFASAPDCWPKRSRVLYEQADALRVLIESVDSGWVRTDERLPDEEGEYLVKRRAPVVVDGRVENYGNVVFYPDNKFDCRFMCADYSHWRKIVPPEQP